MSYSVTGVFPSSSNLSSPGSDLYSGFGSLHAYDKTPNGQPEAFKTATQNNKTAGFGPETVGSTPKVLTPPKTAPIDTVKLSVANQVRSLRQEGEGALQIAATLHLSTKDVENDLYVVTTWPQLLSTVAQSTGTAPTPASPVQILPSEFAAAV